MNKIHVRQVTLKTINATVPKKINTREMLTEKTSRSSKIPPPPPPAPPNVSLSWRSPRFWVTFIDF